MGEIILDKGKTMLISEYVTNKDRKAYRGYSNIQKPNSCLYITYNIAYAFQYAKRNGYIAQYNLKKGVNLFNPRFKKDWEKYKKYCLKNNLSKFLVPLTTLANDDWLNIWNWEGREEFIQIVKDLEYDGFVNYEGKYRSIKIYRCDDWESVSRERFTFSGVGLFDTNWVEKEKTYHGYSEFLTIKPFKTLYDKQKDDLNKRLYEICKEYNQKTISPEIENSIDYDIYTILLQDEIFDIIDNFDYDTEAAKQDKLTEKKRERTREKLAMWYGIPKQGVLEENIDWFLGKNYFSFPSR